MKGIHTFESPPVCTYARVEIMSHDFIFYCCVRVRHRRYREQIHGGNPQKRDKLNGKQEEVLG